MDFKGLINLCDKINVRVDIDGKTAPITSIKVGNTAKLIIYPHDIMTFCEILSYVHENNVRYCVLGNGTNVYFCDEYHGVVIVTTKINNIEINGEALVAECGASILNCAKMALYHCLSGLEFSYGIPGTIGGAVYMNAEAFGCRIGEIVIKSAIYDVSKREVIELDFNEHNFSSKSSIFSNIKNYYLLKTYLKLSPNDFDNIRGLMIKNLNKRIISQPLNLPSAGSAFKRTNDVIPSKLIDEAGLKGYSIGDAQISKKHAGFIVNLGNAKASDINNLISYIKSEIYNKFNQSLEEEIIYIE